MDDYNEYVKKKRTIRYAILLVVCIVVSFVAGMLVWRGTHIDHSKEISNGMLFTLMKLREKSIQ